LSWSRTAVAPLIFSTEDAGAPGGLQLGYLIAEALGVGRDTGVAIEHARIVHQKLASENVNQISDPGLMQMS